MNRQVTYSSIIETTLMCELKDKRHIFLLLPNQKVIFRLLGKIDESWVKI